MVAVLEALPGHDHAALKQAANHVAPKSVRARRILEQLSKPPGESKEL